jgi:hypothetical protein
MKVRLHPRGNMAVFLVNNCVFPGCGMTFETLSDLIQHIEDVHIGIVFHYMSVVVGQGEWVLSYTSCCVRVGFVYVLGVGGWAGGVNTCRISPTQLIAKYITVLSAMLDRQH